MMYQNRNHHHNNNTIGRTAVAADPASTAVHDGFATVRRPHHYVGHKRRRAATAAVGLHLEPVSEHVGGEQLQLYSGLRPKSCTGAAAALPPLPSDVPWWEIATRRRPKSCADFGSTSSDDTEKAHVVSAFEQSLSNMTQRLQQLTATAEKKDHELHELRQTVEMLRKQSSADLGNHPNGGNSNNHQRRHTINSVADSSTDSVSSLNSLSSACSASSSAQQSEADKKKKRGWVRPNISV